MHGAQTNFFMKRIGNSSKKSCCSGQQNETTTSMWHVDYRDTTSCWSNTTQNHTDHTRFELQESHQTYVIHNTFQFPFCFPSKVEHPWQSRSYAFIQEWYGDKDFSPESSLIPDTEKDRWPNHMFTDGTFERKPSRTYAKHVEDCKVGVEDLIEQKFELNTDLTLEHFQIHQPAVFMHHPPTADSDDLDYESLMDRNDQRAHVSQTSSSTTTQSWACGSWSQTNESWQGHWQYFGLGHSKRLTIRPETNSNDFGGFWKYFSRFEFDFRRCGNYFLNDLNFWCVQSSITHNVTVHVRVLWPVCAHTIPFRMLWRP